MAHLVPASLVLTFALLAASPAPATTPLDGCALDYTPSGTPFISSAYTDRTAIYADGADTATIFVQLPPGAGADCIEVWAHCSIVAPSTGHGLYRYGDFAEVQGCPAGPAGGWSFVSETGLVDNASLWDRTDYLTHDSAVLVDEVALVDDGTGADEFAGDGVFTGRLQLEATWAFDDGMHMPLNLKLPAGPDGQGGYYRRTERTLGIVRPGETVPVVDHGAGLLESPSSLFYEDPGMTLYDGPMPALTSDDGNDLVGPWRPPAAFMKERFEEIAPGWTDLMVINSRLEPRTSGMYMSSHKILHSRTGFGHTRNHEILHEFNCYMDDPEMLDALCWGARHWRAPSTVGDVLNNHVSAYVDGILCAVPQYSGETPAASDLASIFTMYSMGLAGEAELVDVYWADDGALGQIQYCNSWGMQPNPFTVYQITADQLVQAEEQSRYRSPFFARRTLNVGHAVYSHQPFSMAEIVYFDSDARFWGERTHWDGYGLVPFSFTMHGRMTANTRIGVVPVVPEADSDGDGVLDADDCASWEPAAWNLPGEVDSLVVDVAGGSTDVVLSWSDVAWQAGPGMRYDVVSGLASELQAAGGFADAACLFDSDPDVGFVDSRPDPAPGQAYFYVVRAQNLCGGGGYGDGSRGGLEPCY